MTYGTKFKNAEGYTVLDTSIHMYQFVGRYSGSRVYGATLSNQNAIGSGLVPWCVQLDLPAACEAYSTQPTDWMCFARYVGSGTPIIVPTGLITVPERYSKEDEFTRTTPRYMLSQIGYPTPNGSSYINMQCVASWRVYNNVPIRVGDTLEIFYFNPVTASCNVNVNGTISPGTFSNIPGTRIVTGVNYNTLNAASPGAFPSIGGSTHLSNMTVSSPINSSISAGYCFTIRRKPYWFNLYTNGTGSLNPADYEFYLFCKNYSTRAASTGYGMRTFDSSGICSFNTNSPLLKPAARLDPNLSNSGLVAGFRPTRTFYSSTTLPNYSPTYGSIPTTWATGQSSPVGYYYCQAGSGQSHPGGSVGYMMPLFYTVDPLNPSTFALRPAGTLQSAGTWASNTGWYPGMTTVANGYLLPSLTGHASIMAIDTQQYSWAPLNTTL